MPDSGAATHGDYMFGWQGNSLQQALDSNCELNQNCGGLTLGQPSTYHGCKVDQVAPEQVEGCESCNPCRSGPDGQQTNFIHRDL
jgi:hypothetical protein